MTQSRKFVTAWRRFVPIACGVAVLSGPTRADNGIVLANNVQSLQEQWHALQLTPELLEKNNAIIGEITIDNQNVFNLEDPEEDKWLYRVANKIHVRTRPEVIKSQLLFASGVEYSQQKIEESERLLRKNRYIHDADIDVAGYEDGIVDLTVRTQDVWTLKADFSFGRKGGVNTGGFGLRETNLLGTGTHVGMHVKRTVDRDIASINFANTHVRGSRYTLRGGLAINSDGFEQKLSIFKPFFSLDSRRAGGFTIQRAKRVEAHYELGKVFSEFRHQSSHYDFFRGWSKGLNDGWTRRWIAGITYDDNRFSAMPAGLPDSQFVPADRRFLYPYIGFEVVEDHYEKALNFDQIHRTEDRYLGTRYGLRIGYSPSNSVSTTGTVHFHGEYHAGLKLGEAETLITDVNFSGRQQGGIAANALLSGTVTYHRKQSGKRLFFASLTASIGDNLDLDNTLYLGGTDGLRGFPLRYQSGTARALLTVEQRYFTDWYPFRLFRVGGAVFFDAGQTWGNHPVGGEDLGLLKNIGFGLRFASTRSSEGRMLHVDIAYPLDKQRDISGVQFLLAAKRSF